MHGLSGAGSEGALETAGVIAKELADLDVIFVTAGLGGGTGRRRVKVSLSVKVNKGMYEEMRVTIVLAGIDSPLLDGALADLSSIVEKLRHLFGK